MSDYNTYLILLMSSYIVIGLLFFYRRSKLRKTVSATLFSITPLILILYKPSGDELVYLSVYVQITFCIYMLEDIIRKNRKHG
jgi:hypothetical protein